MNLGDIPLITLIKFLTGILWSILFFVGSAIVGALVASGLDKLLTFANFFSPSLINSFTIISARLILLFGTIAGFYLGYSRTLKKDAESINNKQLLSKLASLVIILLAIGIPIYILYLNIRAYNRYVYYVKVTDEKLFNAKINPLDPKILSHGRALKEEIIKADKDIDGGDGRKKGTIRWFECYGIDCDEGFESRFYK